MWEADRVGWGLTGRRAAPRRRVHPTRSTLPVRHPDLARFCVNRAQSFPDLETWTCVDLVPIWFRRRHAPFSLVSASIAPIPVATGSLGHTWQKNGKTIVTGASRVISVRSTGPAERSLSSMIGRVSLYSTSYERLMGVDNCCGLWPLGACYSVVVRQLPLRRHINVADRPSSCVEEAQGTALDKADEAEKHGETECADLCGYGATNGRPV